MSHSRGTGRGGGTLGLTSFGRRHVSPALTPWPGFRLGPAGSAALSGLSPKHQGSSDARSAPTPSGDIYRYLMKAQAEVDLS